MNILINETLKAYIDPLTPDEYSALERSLLAEGCRDALVLWGEVLVDGHNRYSICQKHNLPFKTVQNTRFQSMEDVYLWMIDQHLGRRSISDFQRGVLALRKKDIVSQQQRTRQETKTASEQEAPSPDTHEDESTNPPLNSREAIAKAAGLKSSQVVLIEKIQKQAVPEVVAAVKSGTISINAAAAVASLPVAEQVAAATAGTDELKQAAKRAREARRKPREEQAPVEDTKDTLQALQQRIAELTAENETLRHQITQLQLQLAG